ncbi:hypothetical protein LDENG_00052630 [Lucifuga dentata]|nr:hypothetical protein LDENG_00052630 [Lucifuga dentata]
MEGRTVRIWPRTDPFLLAALPVAASSKLSWHYLRKMATYVRTQDGCFPALSWPKWRHIACGKLQLPEELAWLYIETFDLFSGNTPKKKLEWAECLSECSSQSELNQQRSRLCVDTLQFLLFLYIQQLNRVSLRTSLIGEEWPSLQSRSASPSAREAKNSFQNKNWDCRAHLSFLQRHLAAMLELLVEPEQLSQSGHAQPESQVSLEAVRALSLVLEGSLHYRGSVRPVHRLLTHNPLQTQAGYSKLSCSFSLQQLLCCLKDNLTVNPFALCSVEEVKRNLIVSNSNLAPPGSKMMLMSQVFKKTVAENSDALTGANIKIHRCSHAFIYLLSPLRSVSVDKCRDTMVVLGPVEISVHVNSCKNVRVVCVAGRVVVRSSSGCTIHALTPTHPLLLPGNSDITLGPFHTYYPSLEEDMASVGLAVVPNAWDKPLLLGTEGLVPFPHKSSSSPDPACYRLLPPAEFDSLAVPFHMNGDTCDVPGGLPPQYQAVLDKKQEEIQKWFKSLQEAHLDKEQQGQLQEEVETMFHDWLIKTGHKRELSSLAMAGGLQ